MNRYIIASMDEQKAVSQLTRNRIRISRNIPGARKEWSSESGARRAMELFRRIDNSTAARHKVIPI